MCQEGTQTWYLGTGRPELQSSGISCSQPCKKVQARAGHFYTATTLGGRIHTPCSLLPAPLLRAPYLHPCRVTSARLVSSCLPCSLPQCACYVKCRVICSQFSTILLLHAPTWCFLSPSRLFVALPCPVLPGCLPTDSLLHRTSPPNLLHPDNSQPCCVVFD